MSHSFSWRPVRAATRSVSRQTSALYERHVAGRPDDPMRPRYVFPLSLTHVAIVSCDAVQALRFGLFEPRVGISVNQLVLQKSEPNFNTQHTTPHDLKRGVETRLAMSQLHLTILSAPIALKTTSSAFSSASSRCLDLLVMFREGRALLTLPSDPR